MQNETSLTNTCHQIFLGIGSNINPVENIRSGLVNLRSHDEKLIVSNTYQSEAVGFKGPHFLNLVVRMNTSSTINELAKTLKKIEYSHGRESYLDKYSSRTLDIDLLTYDDLNGNYSGMDLPRPDITMYAYVLRPFAELAPTMLLPGSSRTVAALWEKFDRKSQPLEKMSICW